MSLAGAVSSAVSSVSSVSSKTRVEGTITNDGRVLCSCGKRCGGVEDGLVTFSCQCGNLVTLDSDILFIRTCDNAINRIANIVDQMAAKKKSYA